MFSSCVYISQGITDDNMPYTITEKLNFEKPAEFRVFPDWHLGF